VLSTEKNISQIRQPLDAPAKHGVYIIRQGKIVLHVGRTVRGQGGLRQRLNNHLHEASSFTREYLEGKGAILRKSGYTYQFLNWKTPENEHYSKPMQLERFAPNTLALENNAECQSIAVPLPSRLRGGWGRADNGL
jgi:hypothetical protein